MQSLLSVGEYVILSNKTPYINVKAFTNYQENITIRGGATILRREFRYSFDNDTFSEFVDLTPANLATVAIKEKMYFQFRYILLSGGPVDITSVGLIYEIAPVDPYVGYVAPNIADESRIYAFPVSYRSNFTWQPYKLNRAIRLYKDLNLVANNLFGHEVWYYRYSPQLRSKDVVLMEYSLGEHDEKVCAKVVVPNNQFPDNKMDMGPFGQDWEMPFEVQMDKDYFQSLFGDGAGPQKRDVLFFPRTSRIYEVSSSYLFRDFMNEPLYFKVTLIKWLPKKSADQSESLNDLESYTTSVDKLFGAEIVEDQKRHVDPQQTNISTTREDPVRSYLNLKQEIVQQNLMNYFTVVSEYYYDLSSLLTNKILLPIQDDLVKNTIFYLRLAPGLTAPDEQYYFSQRKVQYLREIDGGKIFEILPGSSSLQNMKEDFEVLANNDLAAYIDEYPSASTPIGVIQNGYIRYFDETVTYKENGSFPTNEDRSFSAWFKLNKNLSRKIPCSIAPTPPGFSLGSYAIMAVSSNEIAKHLLIGDNITITRSSGGNFLISASVAYIDDKTITLALPSDELIYVQTVFPSYLSYTDLVYQKSEPLVLISSKHLSLTEALTEDNPLSILLGKGVEIAMLENRHVSITCNDQITTFSIPNTSSGLDYEKWYAIFVNFSNSFNQMSVNLWERQWDSTTNLPATTDLKLIYTKTVTAERVDRSSPASWHLKSSRLSLTNVRLYNRTAETEKQALMLNQNIVRDSQWSLVIDNSIPQSRLPLIGNTR